MGFTERDVNMIQTIETIAADLKSNVNGTQDMKANGKGKQEGNGVCDECVIVAIIGLAHVNSMLNIVNNAELMSFAQKKFGTEVAVTPGRLAGRKEVQIVRSSECEEALY